MKIKKNKIDRVFSDLVRERNNYVCQNCCEGNRHRPHAFDCAHIMGRRNVGLRWHPDNCLALCRSCHIFFTEHPFDFRDFCVDQFGEDRVAELRLISNQTVKWNKPLREEIYKHYKREWVLMQDYRIGSELRIDFQQHECMHIFA